MKKQPHVVRGKIKLKDFDPAFNAGWDKEETKLQTEALLRRIGELQPLLNANGKHALLLVFQGMDTSGKDGAVRTVLQEVNPAGVEVANFKAPSTEERAHDYLWRVHKRLPRFGNIGVFNRSHYEAVLAERVLKIVPESDWRPRYDEIIAWERMLARNNIHILKFFLHLSKNEQAERLNERLHNPEKNWKFSPDDLKTRKLWPEYMRAYEDMLNHTSHDAAPWHIVPTDRNWYRNRIVAEVVVKTLEGLKLTWPKPSEDLSKLKID